MNIPPPPLETLDGDPSGFAGGLQSRNFVAVGTRRHADQGPDRVTSLMTEKKRTRN